MDFQPTLLQRHSRPSKSSTHTPESRYWKRFRHPVFIKEYAPVTSVHFAPTAPHRYAVTAATRVQIYAPRTQKITKTIARFKDVARSGNIRNDGKLVVAGDDSGLIQVFDINSRAILRTLDEHKQPVHVAKFSPVDTTQLLSCSDDTTVKLWDIPSQTAITTFTDHTDYVRAGHILSSNPSLLLTGSYDSTVRLFDARTGSCELTMGSSAAGQAPVEDVLAFPSGSLALSVSGSILRAWDLVAGGRCVRALSNHQKTVTCLTFDGQSSSRLLTGGLDHMVKVYDVATYKVVHTMRYPAPVLCLAVSPDNTHIAAGMSDGTFSVRRRQPKAHETAAAQAKSNEASQYQFFLDAGNIGQGLTRAKPKTKGKGKEAVDQAQTIRVKPEKRKKLREYDVLLKSFKYGPALDAVLKKAVPPATAFSVITELVHRDGLRIALGGRDDVLLEPVLHLLVKHISDPRFGELACDVATVVLDMYSSALGQSPLIDSLFVRLRKKVIAEVRFQNELVAIRGALDMLFAANTLA